MEGCQNGGDVPSSEKFIRSSDQDNTMIWESMNLLDLLQSIWLRSTWNKEMQLFTEVEIENRGEC